MFMSTMVIRCGLTLRVPGRVAGCIVVVEVRLGVAVVAMRLTLSLYI